MLGDDDQCRGQAAEVGRLEGSSELVRAILTVSQVVAPVPRHRISVEKQRVNDLAHGGRVWHVVHNRINEQLEVKHRSASLSGKQGYCRGEIPARTVAANGDASGITTDCRSVVGQPQGSSVTIIEGCGELVLWC